MTNRDPKRKKELVTLVVVFLGVLIVSALAVYFLASRTAQPEPTRETVQTGTQPSPDPGAADSRSARSAQGEPAGGNFFERLMGPPAQTDPRHESWGQIIASLTLRLLLAALLASALAFRPRRRPLALKRNPYVAQTQILLAVVASALMIIVGDNAARAFGIFAAVSLVRFRTNIRDPKEVTVLLMSLAIGLGTGVGRWDLSVILTIFALIALWVLEYREPEQVFRTMILKIVTRNTRHTQAALREVLKKHGFDSEFRALGNPGTEGQPGSLAYSIEVSPTISTDELSEEILSRNSQDIDSLEWDQKKSFSYLYQ